MQEVNQLQKQIIEDQDTVIVGQKEELDQSRAWYHDPVKTIGLGFLAGLLGGIWIQKR